MAFKDKDAAFRYINAYQKEKYDRITILRKSGEKAQLEKIASDKGYNSLSAFINACVDEKLRRSGIALSEKKTESHPTQEHLQEEK